jgi:hypothetical protein
LPKSATWQHGIYASYKRVKAEGHPRAYSSGYFREHILVAERIIGHLLPPGAVVHHVDENRRNNSPSSLVICQDAAYHNLLHMRARALSACGNANFIRCPYCKRYDAPENLINASKNPARSAYCHAFCKKQADRKHYLENADKWKEKNRRNYLRRKENPQ